MFSLSIFSYCSYLSLYLLTIVEASPAKSLAILSWVEIIPPIGPDSIPVTALNAEKVFPNIFPAELSSFV